VANRESLAKLLAAADVVIAPGPAETFGLSALEALASGTPVVVSSRSALPEVGGPPPPTTTTWRAPMPCSGCCGASPPSGGGWLPDILRTPAR